MRYELAARVERAGDLLRERGAVLVAYSGGVDSSLVLEIGHRVLGERCTGILASSPSLPAAELEGALALAAARGIGVEVHPTAELERPEYLANAPDRCYHCKVEVYGLLARLARERGATPVDGFNRDDRADWRPGRRAAVENGVISPLDLAGMGKDDVREAARELGLPNWDKPAAACLSSRIPYGTPVTLGALSRVEAAEAALRAEGFAQVRVRDHGSGGEEAGSRRGADGSRRADGSGRDADGSRWEAGWPVASVEVEPESLARLREPERLARLTRALLALGYGEVHVDPEGYLPGKLNRAPA